MPIEPVAGPPAIPPGAQAASPAPVQLTDLSKWHPNENEAAKWKGFTFQGASWPVSPAIPNAAFWSPIEALDGVRGTAAMGTHLRVAINDVTESAESKQAALPVIEAILEQSSQTPGTNLVFMGAKEMAGEFDPAKSYTARFGEVMKVGFAAGMLGDEFKGIAAFKSASVAGAVTLPDGRVGPKLIITVAPGTTDANKLRIAEVVRTHFPFVDMAFAQKAKSGVWSPAK